LRAAAEPGKPELAMSTQSAASRASSGFGERVKLVIAGRVQGVGYRASAAHAAIGFKLRGWVRNLRSGEVELLAEGPRQILESLIAWCRRGPPAARVDSVDVEFSAASGEFSDFRVRRDT
jgi:acylphosphatase